MIDLRRILVPTDFSKHSQHALTYAAALAEKFGAEIFLLHVVQDFAVFLPDTVTAAPPALPPPEQLNTAVREALARSVREANLGSLRVHTEARAGTPYHEIVTYAQEQDIDLVIMGTHGRTGLAHLLLGSVTERVVRRSRNRALAALPSVGRSARPSLLPCRHGLAEQHVGLGLHSA